jgi:hypothetical protein
LRGKYFSIFFFSSLTLLKIYVLFRREKRGRRGLFLYGGFSRFLDLEFSWLVPAHFYSHGGRGGGREREDVLCPIFLECKVRSGIEFEISKSDFLSFSAQIYSLVYHSLLHSHLYHHPLDIYIYISSLVSFSYF